MSDNKKDMDEDIDDKLFDYIIIGYAKYEKERYDKKLLKVFKVKLTEKELKEYFINEYIEKLDITLLSIHKLDNDTIQEFDSVYVHIPVYCDKECCD